MSEVKGGRKFIEVPLILKYSDSSDTLRGTFGSSPHGVSHYLQQGTLLIWDGPKGVPNSEVPIVYAATFSESSSQILSTVNDVIQQQESLLPHPYVIAL